MATFNLAFHTRLEDYAILQTFVDTDIQSQDSVVVAGAAHNFNGTHTVISTEPYLFMGVSEEGDLVFDYDTIMAQVMTLREVLPAALSLSPPARNGSQAPMSPVGLA